MARASSLQDPRSATCSECPWWARAWARAVRPHHRRIHVLLWYGGIKTTLVRGKGTCL
jgi:hypothetical protein